jgi:hypothetical protein
MDGRARYVVRGEAEDEVDRLNGAGWNGKNGMNGDEEGMERHTVICVRVRRDIQ